MQSQFLMESLDSNSANIITESRDVNGKKNITLQGVFMQAESKNRNGRVYPLQEMVNSVKQANQIIKENGGIFGELDHPEGITINMDRISHAIKELYMEGNDVYGKAVLLDTPMGKIAQELSESGVRYGVSSRGAGTVNEGGLVSDYRIVTVDLVATPSANAWPKSITESVQENQKVMTLAEAAQNDDAAQKYFKKEIRKFLEEFYN